VSMSTPYPLQLEFQAERRITWWRPLVQWFLAIPHLMIAGALCSLRQVLTLVSFFSVQSIHSSAFICTCGEVTHGAIPGSMTDRLQTLNHRTQY
jgi:hypothetical protein